MNMQKHYKKLRGIPSLVKFNWVLSQLVRLANFVHRGKFIYLQAETSLRSISAWMPYHAARSVWGLSRWVSWECYLPAPIDTLYGKNVGTRHSVKNMALGKFCILFTFGKVKVIAEIWCCIGRKYIVTMTTIDTRPNPCVTHRRQASACKISLPYVASFQRR